jgi:DnaK suppressor protein
MTSEEKEKLKKEIEGKIASIKLELGKLKARDKPFVSDRAHGRMGRIDAIQSKSLYDRGVLSLEIKLQGLEKNLLNIDSGEFGICEYCKGPIGKERLEAVPEAEMCIKCADKFS